MVTDKLYVGCLAGIMGLLLSVTPVSYGMDVTLQWDANTEPEVAGYLLYYDKGLAGGPYEGRGATEGDSPIDVGNVTEFTLHDLPDGKVYFFVVTAYRDDGVESGYSNEVDALSIHLDQGSNLISLYRQPFETNIADVLEPISGKYSSVWAFIDGGWRVYDPVNPGFSDLKEMEAGRGYWIDMSQAGTLPVFGSKPSNQINLVSGPNLVGYNLATIRGVVDVTGSIEDYCESIWTYTDGSWRVYDPANPGFSDLDTMEPGYGYWIGVSEPCVWILP